MDMNLEAFVPVHASQRLELLGREHPRAAVAVDKPGRLHLHCLTEEAPIGEQFDVLAVKELVGAAAGSPLDKLQCVCMIAAHRTGAHRNHLDAKWRVGGVEHSAQRFPFVVGVEILAGEARRGYFLCLEQCRKLCLTYNFDSPSSEPLSRLRCRHPGRRGQTR